MPNMVNEERAKFIKDIQDEKARYEAELRSDPSDPAAKENLKRVNKVLERYGVQLANEDNSKMKDGGMARGKGNKMYQHNYATGGSVTDNLSQVRSHPGNMGKNRGMGDQMRRGAPISVQRNTAVAETPLQRAKRKQMGM